MRIEKLCALCKFQAEVKGLAKGAK